MAWGPIYLNLLICIFQIFPKRHSALGGGLKYFIMFTPDLWGFMIFNHDFRFHMLQMGGGKTQPPTRVDDCEPGFQGSQKI